MVPRWETGEDRGWKVPELLRHGKEILHTGSSARHQYR